MSELLPCPFCGKPAIESWSRDNEVVNIRCSNWRSNVCLGAGPNSYNLDEAIAAWNRRAQPSAEPVAWMHGDPGRVDVIHEAVRKLLKDSADGAGHLHRPLDRSERYNIPLYPHPPAAEIEALRRDAERLDSGCIMTHERDEFGEEYRCERRGLDLRTLIDEAIAEQESLND